MNDELRIVKNQWFFITSYIFFSIPLNIERSKMFEYGIQRSN